jgi:hypothetical protein
MLRIHALAAAAGVAALTSLNAMAADPLPTETFKVLTVDLAIEAAQAAIAACKAQGYNVTVTVADRLGKVKVQIVRDGPPGVGAESTRRKAHGRPATVTTDAFTKRSTPGAFNQPFVHRRRLAPAPDQSGRRDDAASRQPAPAATG